MNRTIEPTCTIAHAEGSYPVYVAVGALATVDELIRGLEKVKLELDAKEAF